MKLEPFLSYWLSRYILSSGPKDSINAYVFLLAVRLAKGKRLPLEPPYLGHFSLVRPVCSKHYLRGGAIRCGEPRGQQLPSYFPQEDFSNIAPRPMEIKEVTFFDLVVDDEVRKKKKRHTFMPRTW